jgi:hypothetical protein
MSESPWIMQGATLSLKNACKEYGLMENEIVQAMRSGKLQYRENYAHGNPYFKLIRSEVKSLAKALHGAKALEEHEENVRLKNLNREINSLKRKLVSLEKQKIVLLEDKSRRESSK